MPSELKRVVLIHNQTAEAVENFHSLYIAGQNSDPQTGVHVREDLLRAMLLFACSGLDAVVKQLVQDSLELVLKHDEGAQREFQKFAERRLKKGSINEDRTGSPAMDMSLLAEILVSFDPRARFIDALTQNLIADSLQSRDQLLRVASHFALTRDEVMKDAEVTKEAFDARNQITHEMDIDLKSGKGRRDRKYDTMVRLSENIATVSQKFVEMVAKKVAPPEGEALHATNR